MKCCHYNNSQALYIMTNAVLPVYNGPAITMSIISLSMSPITVFMFRQYFRSLQFLQMAYYFAVTMWTIAFSGHLWTSVVAFDKNILTFCTDGDIVCTIAFPLSFGVVLVGVIIFFFIIFIFQRCCKPELEFEPMFALFKGFIKWIYLPLVYHSTIFISKAIDGQTDYNDMGDFIWAGAILGICMLFPLFQLIGYKCIQKEDTPIWRKWTQYFGYIRLGSVGVLLGLATNYANDLYLHLAMIGIIIYPLIHLWKGEFKYPIAERIIFIIGEAAFLTIYFLFKYGPSLITDYDLDFLLLAGVLLLDVLLYFVRAIRMCCYGFHEGKTDNIPENQQANAKSISP